MIRVALPDGQEKVFEDGSTGFDVAASISASLKKSAIAVKINGQMSDLFEPLPEQSTLEIITYKDPQALEIIRHDAAHILAMAVQELYPGTQVTIGPVIEDGFFYDFAREQPFTPEDLPIIEKKMHEIVARDEETRCEIWQRDKAIAHFRSIGEHYKAELIEAIPDDQSIRIYFHGEWLDLCRGPHMPSTRYVGKAFRLLRVAGAYWRGDSRNPMLQRIYGTAWRTKQELDDYLKRLEEAEKRDHRRLGKQMQLFHQQSDAAGMVFWHPRGNVLWRRIEDYMRQKLIAHDYAEVRTPLLLDHGFWQRSGHWDKFRENMFTCESEAQTLALKPMNCPCHVAIFQQDLKSYRDLPLRMFEFGSCHRNEPSGALHGLMRVRNFTQDDAHIFCTPEQISSETVRFCRLLEEVYCDFGFSDFHILFSDRPEQRAGSDDVWDQAEEALQIAVAEAGYDCHLNPGEGAFYGPKLEFILKDAIGRQWQCGTLQVDLVLPERLDAVYIDSHGERCRPVMLHRAVLGSFERFIGILIEHHSGHLPVWLAPVQVVVATIVSDADEYANSVVETLRAAGITCHLDIRNEKIGYKVREHTLAKIPFLWAIGRQEVLDKTVAVREHGTQKQITMSLEDAIEQIKIKARILSLK